MLESPWWGGIIEDFLKKILSVRNVEFWWIFVIGNSIKLKNIGFWRRNYLSYEITLGPMAHATLMYKINEIIWNTILLRLNKILVKIMETNNLRRFNTCSMGKIKIKSFLSPLPRPTQKTKNTKNKKKKSLKVFQYIYI